MSKSIKIRGERPRDIHRIAELNAMAFKNSNPMEEVVLVDSLRHRREFDPELSLVAEMNGELVGHILFSPCRVKLENDTHRAAILAPLAVHPDYQNQGIGSMLVEEGHKRLKKEGIQCSFLLGHPNYYSRFGYDHYMFSDSNVKINRNDINNELSEMIKERKPELRDIDTLQSMWSETFSDTDLAVRPGHSITDWVSCGRGITTSVLEMNDIIVAYLRYETDHPQTIKSLLINPDQRSSFEMVITYLNQKLPDEVEVLELPLDPNSTTIQKLITIPFETVNNIWPAAMLTVLNPENEQLMVYVDSVKEKLRKPGMITWPVEFDVC